MSCLDASINWIYACFFFFFCKFVNTLQGNKAKLRRLIKRRLIFRTLLILFIVFVISCYLSQKKLYNSFIQNSNLVLPGWFTFCFRERKDSSIVELRCIYYFHVLLYYFRIKKLFTQWLQVLYRSWEIWVRSYGTGGRAREGGIRQEIRLQEAKSKLGLFKLWSISSCLVSVVISRGPLTYFCDVGLEPLEIPEILQFSPVPRSSNIYSLPEGKI